VTVLRDDVFRKISDPQIRAYVVWEPILRSDGVEALPDATSIISSDSRAVQYWDPAAEVGKRFSRSLDLPLKTPAWDIYLLYSPEARWDSEPPQPAFWMHQLGFPPWSDGAKRFGKQWLDGAKFREAVEKLLQSSKPGPHAEWMPSWPSRYLCPSAEGEAKALVWS
jgi:hypothetical protein